MLHTVLCRPTSALSLFLFLAAPFYSPCTPPPTNQSTISINPFWVACVRAPFVVADDPRVLHPGAKPVGGPSVYCRIAGVSRMHACTCTCTRAHAARTHAHKATTCGLHLLAMRELQLVGSFRLPLCFASPEGPAACWRGVGAPLARFRASALGMCCVQP
jgi:hypothetical protein